MSFIQGKEQTVLIIDELNENTPYINAHTMSAGTITAGAIVVSFEPSDRRTYEEAREGFPL